MDDSSRRCTLASKNDSSVRLKPFNMRYVSLENFPSNDRRSLNRIAAINRFKEDYLIKCPFKSLSLLRKILQTKINDEIKKILQKNHDTFIQPVFNNIRENLRHDNLANELNINAMMHQILEEAKKMFPLQQNDSFFEKLKIADNRNNEDDDNKEQQPNSSNYSQTSSARPRGRPRNNRQGMKTKVKQKRKGQNNKLSTKNSKDKSSVNQSINDKWDPNRFSTKTLFVLGSKANKALGFGAARGRLYTKHSDLFRYIGDHEDKEWLHKNQLMPPTGGKAYLLVKDDIVELMNSQEYRNTPGVNMDDMGEGFTVPQSMIEKITTSMNTLMKTKSKSSSTSKIKGQLINRFMDDNNSIMEESTTASTTTSHLQQINSQISSVASDLSFIDSNELNLSQFNEEEDKDFPNQND